MMFGIVVALARKWQSTQRQTLHATGGEKSWKAVEVKKRATKN
jgi:hypothetical protein